MTLTWENLEHNPKGAVVPASGCHKGKVGLSRFRGPRGWHKQLVLVSLYPDLAWAKKVRLALQAGQEACEGDGKH